MVIDLTACTGCNACVVACQAENNIAIVGKDQVCRGREMHWIRIDRYFVGDDEIERDPEDPLHPARRLRALRGGALRERLPGQRHDAQPRGAERDGLQPLHRHALLREQLPVQGAPLQLPRTGTTTRSWTRCTGGLPETLQMQKNPNVTVRFRGVMEKCTYCVQRIQAAKIRVEARGPRDQGRRDPHGLPADLPGRRDRLRRPQRPATAASRSWSADRPRLRPAGGARDAPAHDVPRQGPQPEPGDGLMAYCEPITRARRGAPRQTGRARSREVTDDICRVTENQRAARLVDRASSSPSRFAGIFVFCVGYLFWRGVGVWGNTAPVYWAWDITNFVCWVGIGHAGTLITAILFLFRQKWRTAINRFAEAMTIFAVICALIFPGIHVGRAVVRLLHVPVPEPDDASGRTSRARSLWDVFAVSTYFTVSLLFWYVGLIPDLATPARPRARPSGASASTASSPSAGAAANRHWQQLRARVPDPRRHLDAARALACTASCRSTSPRRSSPAGTRRSSRPTSSPAPSSAASRWSMTLLLIARAVFELKRLITDAAPRADEQDHPPDGHARRLRVRDGVLHRLVLRQRVRDGALLPRTAPTGPYWWAWMLDDVAATCIVPQLFWFKRCARASR